MTNYSKPLPVADQETRPYWDGIKRHELLIQRCKECGKYCFPPLPMCPYCSSMDRGWSKVSGRGRVYSWIIVNMATHAAFRQDVPYAVALVQLDEQEDVRIAGNVIDCSIDELKADMPVQVVFDDVTPDVSIPRWKSLV